MEEIKKKKESKGEQTPQWLKTIQLNSWEAELLISALVLYALFQIPDYLSLSSLQYFERGSRMHSLINLLVDAIQLLSFGYILHILVRGIWVASVGLSYVFPGGVDQESLKFKGNFKKELNSTGSLVKMVLRLEELSSIIYGISFIFFGTLVGFGTLLFTFLGFVELITPAMENYPYFAGAAGMIILFYCFLCILVFIDFITNGIFRRKNWSADWYYWVARFFRIVTLSFLYRRSLLVLISNTKGWKSYLIPFIVLGVTAGYMYINDLSDDNVRNSYYKRMASGDYSSVNYENTRNEKDYIVSTIQSDIIHDNTLKVFLKDLSSFDAIYMFEGRKKIEKGMWDKLPSDSITQYFKSRLIVKIDSIEIENLSWFKTQHPTTYRFGFTTFIDLDTFSRGAHFLKIGIDTSNMKPIAKNIVQRKDYSLQTISNIYFIYDKP
ncbi:hypothetical protein [Ekhidna sp.]|uniref:hypothetical protein n=1 Tax=Ekhidna sp. TaxID=2608089 RepID=UPI003299BEFF